MLTDNNILYLAHQRKQRRARAWRILRLTLRAARRDPECRDLLGVLAIILTVLIVMLFN